MYRSMNLTGLFILLTRVAALAQVKPRDMNMDYEEYEPQSSLKVVEHKLTKAKFPFIDIHNHYGNTNSSDLGERVKYIDQLNMAIMNNPTGRGFGNAPADIIPKSIENIKKNYPGRFTLFTNID